MALLGIVPARGGSKGVPGKNIRPLAGRPLILRTLDAATGSGVFDSVYVSTDSPAIRDVVLGAGFSCPDLRHPDLARDDTPMIDVLRDVLAKIDPEGRSFDSICLLQPTSPFRTVVHIREAVARFRAARCDTLVSVTRVPHRFHPRKLMMGQDGFLLAANPSAPLHRNLGSLWARNGPAIMIIRAELLRQGSFYEGKTIGYEMDFFSSIDIDDEQDWELARRLMESHDS